MMENEHYNNLLKAIEGLYIIMKTTSDEDAKLVAANTLLEVIHIDNTSVVETEDDSE